jgi:transcription initiation factor TFIIIB Brf1 subunit/transcription initiation factor TFIIB
MIKEDVCKHNIIFDQERGEQFCSKCGMVFDDKINSSDFAKRDINNNLIHNYPLKQNYRSSDKRVSNCFNILYQYRQILNLNDTFVNEVKMLLDKILVYNKFKKQRYDLLVASCINVISKVSGQNDYNHFLSLRAISYKTNIKLKRISNLSREICQELNINYPKVDTKCLIWYYIKKSCKNYDTKTKYEIFNEAIRISTNMNMTPKQLVEHVKNNLNKEVKQ